MFYSFLLSCFLVDLNRNIWIHFRWFNCSSSSRTLFSQPAKFSFIYVNNIQIISTTYLNHLLIIYYLNNKLTVSPYPFPLSTTTTTTPKTKIKTKNNNNKKRSFLYELNALSYKSLFYICLLIIFAKIILKSNTFSIIFLSNKCNIKLIHNYQFLNNRSSYELRVVPYFILAKYANA